MLVNFATWIPDCDSHMSGLLDLFISCDASSGFPSTEKL